MSASSVRPLETLLAIQHPYDTLPEEDRARLSRSMSRRDVAAGDVIYGLGETLPGLFLIVSGRVDVTDESGGLVSILGPGNSFGERGLLRDGKAATGAVAETDAQLYVLPAIEFGRLMNRSEAFKRFFDRRRSGRSSTSDGAADLATARISDLMTADPVTCGPEATVVEIAQMMRERRISCVMVMRDERLAGIVTHSDLTNRALAEGAPGDTPAEKIMTPDPITLSPGALGSDVLHEMLERRIEHLPVVADGRLIGIVTQTDLTRRHGMTSGFLIDEIVNAPDAESIAPIVGRIPALLAQLVGGGARHEVVTRLITDIGDATTRRLLRLAEHRFGPPPVPYLWLACGSQGRQEQTGVSDQDNCLILSDEATAEHDAYFESFAEFVSDGLDVCGYFYCPGDMMATNARWRQPARVWREYFQGWIAKPDPMAQMLASVMFDLRPIGGEESLFSDLATETLELASKNSIFVAHMIANSLGHTPPLGLFRNFATIRSGEHKDTVDLKHNGVAPVVDLGRVYALRGKIEPVNTRARLTAAEEAGVISHSGGHDLLDAYDLIAQTRLEHQAQQVRDGRKPDNFMSPQKLSDLERSHLRDAFVVVKTMQSALGQGHAAVL